MHHPVRSRMPIEYAARYQCNNKPDFGVASALLATQNARRLRLRGDCTLSAASGAGATLDVTDTESRFGAPYAALVSLHLNDSVC